MGEVTAKHGGDPQAATPQVHNGFPVAAYMETLLESFPAYILLTPPQGYVRLGQN